jgi:hypothetical protein
MVPPSPVCDFHYAFFPLSRKESSHGILFPTIDLQTGNASGAPSHEQCHRRFVEIKSFVHELFLKVENECLLAIYNWLNDPPCRATGMPSVDMAPVLYRVPPQEGMNIVPLLIATTLVPGTIIDKPASQ